MGLFDPPAVGIRKRVPAEAHATYDQLQSLTTDAVPKHYSANQNALIVGVVMASWALSEHRKGVFQLPTKEGLYISNMGSNCLRMLGREQAAATSMVDYLIEKGLILEAD